VQQCRHILGLVIAPATPLTPPAHLSLSLYFFFSLNMPPILQQSLAGLQREEVDLRADQDLRSLRCASEIISGIAVTSVHRKPQVFHFYHPFAGF
jgi:hypothetical protein